MPKCSFELHFFETLLVLVCFGLYFFCSTGEILMFHGCCISNQLAIYDTVFDVDWIVKLSF